MVVQVAQLRQVAVRLLEVVADDLLVLDASVPLPAHRFHPVGEALVQGRPPPLEQTLVRGVADEDVVEPEPDVLVRRRTALRPDQLLGLQGAEVDRHLLPGRVVNQRAHRRQLEQAADDGGGLDHGPLLARQEVEAGRQQGVDGGRYGECPDSPVRVQEPFSRRR